MIDDFEKPLVYIWTKTQGWKKKKQFNTKFIGTAIPTAAFPLRARGKFSIPVIENHFSWLASVLLRCFSAGWSYCVDFAHSHRFRQLCFDVNHTRLGFVKNIIFYNVRCFPLIQLLHLAWHSFLSLIIFIPKDEGSYFRGLLAGRGPFCRMKILMKRMLLIFHRVQRSFCQNRKKSKLLFHRPVFFLFQQNWEKNPKIEIKNLWEILTQSDPHFEGYPNHGS